MIYILLLLLTLLIPSAHGMKRAVSYSSLKYLQSSGKCIITTAWLPQWASSKFLVSRALSSSHSMNRSLPFHYSNRTKQKVYARYHELVSLNQIVREYNDSDIQHVIKLTQKDQWFREFCLTFCKDNFSALIQSDKGSKFLYGLYEHNNPHVLKNFIHDAFLDYFEAEIIEHLIPLIQTEKGYMLALEFCDRISLNWNSNEQRVVKIISILRKNMAFVCKERNGVPLLFRIADRDDRVRLIIKDNFGLFLISALQYQRIDYVLLFIENNFDYLEGLLLQDEFLTPAIVQKILHYDDLVGKLIDLDSNNAQTLYRVLTKNQS